MFLKTLLKRFIVVEKIVEKIHFLFVNECIFGKKTISTVMYDYTMTILTEQLLVF